MPDNLDIPPGVTAQTLRSAVLTNADGESVRLGDQMGQGTSVVVFLRHMGWLYCWSYAKAWCELQQQQKSDDIKGPIFVSIGDKDKLELYLEKNPYIPRDQVLVDNYSDFAAYKAAGFGRFDEQDKDVIKAAKDNMAAPDLGGWKGAWSYISNVGKLSPIPSDMKLGQIPEGVLRLGGTFVVSGNDIVYRWSDRLPGDHPDIDNVWKIAREASKKKGFLLQLPRLFG